MPYKDPEQNRLNQARYRQRNKAAIKTRREAWMAANGERYRANLRARYATSPELYRDAELRKRYGINSAEYDAMFEKQNCRCAICKEHEVGGPGNRLHVDHDHKTKKVRGLLCVRCNILLGKADDDPEILKAAIKYLELASRQ